MSKNYFEDELRQALWSEIAGGRIRESAPSEQFFEKISRAFPASGSKIDWSRVPNSIQRCASDEGDQLIIYAAFFDEIGRKFQLSGEVVYVGDSATDFSLTGELNFLRGALPSIFSVPQHHYFIEPEAAWCMCFTMEGDMAFGFKP